MCLGICLFLVDYQISCKVVAIIISNNLLYFCDFSCNTSLFTSFISLVYLFYLSFKMTRLNVYFLYCVPVCNFIDFYSGFFFSFPCFTLYHSCLLGQKLRLLILDLSSLVIYVLNATTFLLSPVFHKF